MNHPLPRWADLGLLPLVNVAVAFAVAGLVVLFVGESPVEAARLLVRGAFGNGYNVGYTLFYATTFVFTGLAVAVAFHAGLFNIGGEGQAYIGGLGVALVALSLDSTLPWWALFPLAILGAAGFGAAWAFVPAILQAKRGSHIVITTIMFNFIAAALMIYLINTYLQQGGMGGSRSRNFAPDIALPKLSGLMRLVGLDTASTPLNIVTLLALVTAFLVWLLIWRTRLGYEMRTLGTSPRAAVYAGISETRIVVVAMLISGGLAGMMALNEVLGRQLRLQIDFVEGAGFVGIAVALMGRSHPFGIVLAAVLFGALYQGGAELAFDMPAITRDMIVMIQGLVILFAGAMEHMFRPALSRGLTMMSTTKAQTLPGIGPEAAE